MTTDEIKTKVATLPSFVTDADIECYYKYANMLSNGLIVDLGTGWGKSMLALALSNNTNQLISCDPGSYPIYQGWAENLIEYEEKINNLIRKNNLTDRAIFFPLSADQLLDRIIEKIDLLHLDNWVEMNQIDSSKLLAEWVDRVADGGYLLFRNYGHGDRQPYTDSVDKVTSGLKKIETMGLITVWQK